MRVQRVSGESVLLLEGEFTQSGALACEKPLQEILSEDSETADPVFLDFSRVPYMDSAGFSRWVQLERQVRRAGRELRVRGATALIQDLFRFADLEEVLEP